METVCSGREVLAKDASFALPNWLTDANAVRLVFGPAAGPSQVFEVAVAAEVVEPNGAGCGTARRLGLQVAQDGRTASQVPFDSLDQPQG